MPPRRGRPNFRRPTQRPAAPRDRIEFARRTVPQPPASVTLEESGSDGWLLVCRDGWDWQPAGPGQVVVRAATLSPDQGETVRVWIDKLRDPAVWWSVSREINNADSSPEVADAMRRAPWLAQVLPILLEASVDGAPPPPGPAPARD